MPALHQRGTLPETATTARRSLLLGLACSLAFDRFIVFYRQDSDDQVRDNGRLRLDAAPGSEPETTGSLSRIHDGTAGDPLIDEITDRLHNVASQVHDMLGDGAGARYGTAFHLAFARHVRKMGISDLSAEVSSMTTERSPPPSGTASGPTSLCGPTSTVFRP